MKRDWHSVLSLLFSLMFTCSLYSQNWEFVKEKEGIKLYSKQETGKNNKIFKGVTEIRESAEKVFAVLDDVNITVWWDNNISQVKVIEYEKNKKAKYYLVYDMPWPFKDRDLTVDVTSTINKTSGEFKLVAVPTKGTFSESKDLIRIKDYHQGWTVRPNKNYSQIELEFYIDPDENLPNWLLNMVLIESPINTIKSLKRYIEKNKAINKNQL